MRYPGFDGLRAFAVLLVFAYHLDTGRAGGGLIGVSVFFVLSGYLITTLLLREQSSLGGRIDLPLFFQRRALRLVPALVIAVAAVGVVAPNIDNGWHAYAGDAIAALLYVADFYVGFHQHYGALSHTWSLAVEEQFYLVWPFALLLIARRRPERRTAIVAAGFAVSVALTPLTWLWIGHRAYFMPWARADELLAGALLAVVVAARERPFRAGRWSNVSLLGLLAVLVVLVPVMPDVNNRVWCLGGLAVVAVLSAAVIGLLVSAPSATVTRLLDSRAPTWLGLRSYGFYLYHYPILLLVEKRLHSHLTVGLVALVATLIAAGVSFRFVEAPFLRLKRHPTVTRPPAAARTPCST